MKVECVKIFDVEAGDSVEKNSWLTVGKVYQVLSVFIADNSPAEYRLISDDGRTPGLYKANQFVVVDGELSPNWVANYDAESYFELAPKPWVEASFWEDYFDGDPSAIKVFQDEKEIIIQFDS